MESNVIKRSAALAKQLCSSMPVILLLFTSILTACSNNIHSSNITGYFAYVANDAAGSPQIYVMNLETRKTTQLTKSGYNSDPVWSPNGKKIAFTARDGDNLNIFIINSDGNDQHIATQCNGYSRSPTWAPDGNRIAFVGTCDGNIGIYVLDINNQELTRITKENGDYAQPNWSADGKQIAYAFQPKPFDLEIYTVNIDGTHTEQITTGDLPANSPVWCPDDKCIIYQLGTGIRTAVPKLMIVDLRDNKARPLLDSLLSNPSNMEEWLPSRSPVRGYISFSLQEMIYVLDLQGNKVFSLNIKAFGGSLYP